MPGSGISPAASVLEQLPALRAEFSRSRRVTIPDLVAPDVAERISDELRQLPFAMAVNTPLCGSTCDCARHFHYSVVVDADPHENATPLRAFVQSTMRGPLRDLISTVTGLPSLRDRPVKGRPGLVAHAFPRGGYIEPHTDSFDRLGFVYHASKDWQPEWGGALRFTEQPGESHLPRFGALELFELTAQNRHEVTMVTGPAVRYTLIGRLRESRW